MAAKSLAPPIIEVVAARNLAGGGRRTWSGDGPCIVSRMSSRCTSRSMRKAQGSLCGGGGTPVWRSRRVSCSAALIMLIEAMNYSSARAHDLDSIQREDLAAIDVRWR